MKPVSGERSRLVRYITLVLVAAACGGPAAPRAAADEAPEQRLARAVREESFRDKKDVAARKLAALGTPAAKRALIELLEEFGWTGEAAAVGLVCLGDAEADKVLVARMVENVALCSLIVAEFKVAKRFPLEVLIAQYARLDALTEKTTLIELVSKFPAPAGERVLLERLEAKPPAPAAEGEVNPEREFGRDAIRRAAFQGLARAFPATLAPLAKGLAGDPDLGVEAAGFVLERGTAADLPFFLELIRRAPPAPVAIAAPCYQAVLKWGEPPQKLETYLGTLRGGDAERVQVAIRVFWKLDAPQAAPELRRIARRSEDQAARLAAAERLGEEPATLDAKGRDPLVPYLVFALRETYVPRDDGPPLIIKVFTFGLVDTLDALTKKWDQEAFEHTLDRIGAALERRTGQKLGGDHDAWLAWAVSKGYMLEGRNLVQQLFSPRPAERRKAQDDATRLLGFGGREDFLKKSAGLPVDRDGDVGLALARALIERGFLEDETD
jgi:hypothetical protein